MSTGILFGIVFFYGGVVAANFWLADDNPKHGAWYYSRYYAAIQFAGLSVVVIASYLTIVIVPVVPFYYCMQKYFIATVCELRRISLKDALIYSHFGEAIEGYSTILSFGK